MTQRIKQYKSLVFETYQIETEPLVFTRPLHMIDNKNRNQSPRRFQLDPQLVRLLRNRMVLR